MARHHERSAGRAATRIASWLILGGLTWTSARPGAGTAAEPVVPAPVQATMAVRILDYDRALKTWSGGRLTVGVVARHAGAAAEFEQALSGRDAQGVPIKVAAHPYKDADSLRAWIERNGVGLLYLAPDVAAESAAAVAVAGARKVPVLVASRAQFKDGATVGLVVRDGKPHILVNLGASRAAGMDLDPKLLQLSEVVR
ncbi:MAG TPA: YfiR family protein [Vicinamibacteria bacterium]|nr:YfiR family protein [Vicinamibacteria bacterium]